MPFRKKLRAEENQRILAIIGCNIFFVPSATKNINIEIRKTTILPAVVCGYETWSVTMREERRMRMFVNRVLRRIFEPKRDEGTGEWKIL
jgi:hypothetical protein